jgi:NAD(P)H dehydrogenase (quinone)
MTQAKIFIVFYSTYLHVYQLALAVKQGLEKVSNVQVEIYQIQETLPTEGEELYLL